MEKLVYVLWKRTDATREELRDALIGDVAKTLAEAGARRLAVSAADEHVGYAQGSVISHLDAAIDAVVTFWLDTHLDRAPHQQALQRVSARCAGYLVLESVPLVNTSNIAAPGERTPGINTIAFLEKPDRLSYDEWLEIWQGSHTAVGIETQSSFLYIQNAVVRALTEGAPAWVAIVEEGFPADALRDPMVFYDAGDSEQKLAENRGRMIASCRRFIDFDRLESHVFSQYVLGD
jgi:hypothetical protein